MTVIIQELGKENSKESFLFNILPIYSGLYLG